jgi:DNA-binding beta-propeller fold protein YncE
LAGDGTPDLRLVYLICNSKAFSTYGGKMKIQKTYYLFVLACFLVACATPAKEVLVTPGPKVSIATNKPPTTTASTPKPSTPAGTAATPTSIDPALSVIQFNCSASYGPSNCKISLVDPQTGLAVKSFGSFFNPLGPVAVTSSRLAALQGSGEVCEPMAFGTACRSEADVLHLVNLETSHDVTATLPAQSWVDQAVFSPDGSRLALAVNHNQGSDILYLDTGNGSILASQTISIRPSLLAFDEIEDQLAVYGQDLGPNPGVQPPGDLHVLLLSLPDLKIVWDRQLTGILSGFWCETDCNGFFDQITFANWDPGVVIAPGGRALYIAHADQDKLTTVDFSARTVKTTSIQTARSWLESLLALKAQVAFAKGNQNGTSVQAALSPNGRLLYLLAQSFHSVQDADGNWKTDTSYSGLKVIDVKTGRILNHLDTTATQLQITSDGRFLYLLSWNSPQAETQVVSTKDIKVVKTLVGWQVSLTRRLNGSPLVMASPVEYAVQKTVGILNPQDFSIEYTWKTLSDVQFFPVH